MNTNPLVSIVIPVYNGQNFIHKSIESALNQDYENVEVVVINDGSIDKTEEICLSYGDKIKYFKKENGGVSSALNFGISVMKGDFFSWLSHDDLYYKNKISYQINLLKKNNFNANIVSNKSNIIDEAGKIIRRRKSNNKYKLIKGHVFYKKNIIVNPSGIGLLIKKDLFYKVSMFNLEFRYIQDFDLWQKFALNLESVIISNKCLVESRVHRSQQTFKISNLQPAEISSLIYNQFMIINNMNNNIDFLKPFIMFLGNNTKITKANKVLVKEIYAKQNIFSRQILRINYLKGRFIAFLKRINYFLLKSRRSS